MKTLAKGTLAGTCSAVLSRVMRSSPSGEVRDHADLPQNHSRSRLRRSRRLRAGVGVLAAVAAAVIATPSPAMASGDDFLAVCQYSDFSCQNGVEVTGTVGPFDHCDTAGVEGGYTEVCVRYDGDFVYVRDGRTDGYSALGYIKSQYGLTNRLCRNPYGSGSWARCDFDWREDGCKTVYGGMKYDYGTWQYATLWHFDPGFCYE